MSDRRGFPRPGHRRLFRIIALALGLSPLFALFGLELFLRRSAWAPPPSWGTDVLQGAGLPLYTCDPYLKPSRLCRTSVYFRGLVDEVGFEDPKPERVFRIFCLGGSAVRGHPFLGYGSFSHFLAAGLAAVDPSRRYELINSGVFGASSFDVRLIEKQVMQYEPDLIVIGSGNNEYIGRFPGDEEGWPADARDLLMKGLAPSRVFHFLKNLFAVWPARGGPSHEFVPFSSEHLAFFSEDFRSIASRKAWTQPARERVMARYHDNLSAMASLLQDRKIKGLICTMPVNLRDHPPYEPGEKFPFIGCPPGRDGSWQSGPGNCDRLRDLAFPSAGAAAAFQRGRCEIARGRPESARQWLQYAVDTDPLPRRADTTVNAIIRQAAAEQNLSLVDLEKAFEQASPDQLPGDHLFLDHVHPQLEGAIVTALAIMEAMEREGIIAPPPNWRETARAAMDRYAARLDGPALARAYRAVAGDAAVCGEFCRARWLLEQSVPFAADPAEPRRLMDNVDAAMVRIDLKQRLEIDLIEVE